MKQKHILPLLLSALASPCAVSARDGGAVLSDVESVAGWSRGAALTAPGDAKQGRHAVTFASPEDGTVFAPAFSLTPAQRQQVARSKTLSFWCRFEGSAPKTFLVKVVAAPLAGGWQAVYNLNAPPVGEWRRITLNVQEFTDQWGEQADLASGNVTFRLGKEAGQKFTLVVDDLRTTPLPEGVAVNQGKEPAKITPIVKPDAVRALSERPRLLFAAKDLPAVRKRAADTEWGRAYVAGLRKRCDEAVAKAVVLPDRGGQWYHWYACKTHGTRLKTESPTRHVCPTGGEVYTGYPYDDVVLSNIHDGYANSVRDLGLLYRLTGEKRYGEKAREILLAYAAKYESYPLHTKDNKTEVGGGKVGPQTLDESTWLIPMAQGCDAVWDLLTPADVEKLKTGLFYPAAEVIRKHRMPVHNIQCWKNSAVGLVGLLFNDPALVSEAVDDPVRGLQTQVLSGISEDGPWYEGAWGYHFYTMSALAPLAEALHHSGVPVYSGAVGERYRRLYAAPIDFAMPGGRLPAFNDSGPANANGNALYEIAFARWNDLRFAGPLAASSRQTLHALTAGVEKLPTSEAATAETSRNFPSSGYAILRGGAGDSEAWLCLKYGPHGGGHGHPDKLNFVMYAGGRVLADDPGTANYGVPIQEGWYKTTLAHNTLVVDQTNQKPATGKLLAFSQDSGAGVPAVLAEAGPIYEGVTFRRAAFLLPGGAAAFLDVVRATDGRERTLDLALHSPGKAAAPPVGASPTTPADVPGYSYLRDLRSWTAAAPLSLPLATGEKDTTHVSLVALDGAPLTCMVGTGVGKNTEDRVPALIARRNGSGVALGWALAPGAAAPAVEPVAVAGADGKPVVTAAAARVRHGGATYLLVSNPDGVPLKAGEWSGSDKLAAVKE